MLDIMQSMDVYFGQIIQMDANHGRWMQQGAIAKFLGPDAGTTYPHGVLLSSNYARSGVVTASITLDDVGGGSGRVLFGYDPATGAYYTIGIGSRDICKSCGRG